ncbi:MAG: class A beta-lactamase-related serine hydrolase [candidate division KSB1 bacterium]|nr:class A beta-lactamase-related serine hydrolase [candidate division KSB1 bacterium]MDZ7310162.1 class A beta-lactamase-related serine hydrolase [candidate division KSB1 bacterium]
MFLIFILGFASWGYLWCSGLPSLHLNRGVAMSAVFRPVIGDHFKLGIPELSSATDVTASAIPSHKIFLNAPPQQTSIQDFIQHLADSLHAEIAVAFRDLESEREFFFNERRMMHAASTMKVPVMIEVFRQAETNAANREFCLDDSLLVKNEFSSIVDGSPYSLDVSDDSDTLIYRHLGRKMPIRQLVEQMITVSSNLATNLLIELVGAENIMATLRTLGVKNMQVRRGVEDLKAYRLGLNNQTDALDMMLTLQAIVERRAASPAACDTMLAILKRQKFRDGIPAGLPSGTAVANKTGSITAIAHDCAIVFPESQNVYESRKPTRKPYLLVVLTSGIPEEKTGNQIISEISRKIYHDLILPL